jgi:hypothetical protein
MKINPTFLGSLLLTGMTLGTAWAIRGQFGHEQGAAWAGSLGALAVILLAKRPSWYTRAIPIALAAAIGWGLGGMMSYGRVVGFGKATEFGEVYYGFLMLFVIGGLYGFLGGGLFGLALTDTPLRRVVWRAVVLELLAGALITYFLVIEQWGWLMTPPRSELWAACLGMALALAGYCRRKGYAAPLRVAVFAGLGGGFGFAFGNFLQVLGQGSGLAFNFWNVMEYSLGFFGGVGMAYGTFTARWDTTPTPAVPEPARVPLGVLVGLIPFVVWQQSFVFERVAYTYRALGAGTDWARAVRGGALVLVLGMALAWLWRYGRRPTMRWYADVRALFVGHFGLFAVLSLLITGAVWSGYRPEQYLYVANLLVILLFLGRLRPDFQPLEPAPRRWAGGLAAVVALLALIALLAVYSHGDLPGATKRFG